MPSSLALVKEKTAPEEEIAYRIGLRGYWNALRVVLAVSGTVQPIFPNLTRKGVVHTQTRGTTCHKEPFIKFPSP
jgi:hypothetical protein